MARIEHEVIRLEPEDPAVDEEIAVLDLLEDRVVVLHTGTEQEGLLHIQAVALYFHTAHNTQRTDQGDRDADVQDGLHALDAQVALDAAADDAETLAMDVSQLHEHSPHETLTSPVVLLVQVAALEAGHDQVEVLHILLVDDHSTAHIDRHTHMLHVGLGLDRIHVEL